MPGATVTLTETTRNQIQTATIGQPRPYAFSNLASGIYTVGAELSGFVKAVSQPITLGSAATARVDLVLRVGGPQRGRRSDRGSPLIHTDQIAVGVAVDKALIDTIASKGRNFTSFVQLAPGISTQPRSDNAGTYSAGSHHVIGGIDYVAGGGGNNGFYINGVNANDNYVGGQSYSPSLEAVDEIKVDVANFSAANGRDLSSLSVTTRAGTNKFHGAVYDYFENSALNAWDPLEKQRVTAGHREAVAQPPPVRRQRRRTGPQGQAVLLRQLRADLQPARRRAGVLPRADGRGARKATSASCCARFPDDPNYVLYDPFTTVIGDDGESIRVPDSQQRPAQHHASRRLAGHRSPCARTC